MAKVTKTIRQKIEYRENITAYFDATKLLFNTVAAFYFGVLQSHPSLLDSTPNDVKLRLEKLTHATKNNPDPLTPLVDVATNIPADFRRTAIRVAFGAFRSFKISLALWQKEKEQFEVKLAARLSKLTNPKAKAKLAGLKFKKRPPVPPRNWNCPVVFYARAYKKRTSRSIILKLWTGTAWTWCKLQLSEKEIPEGWEMASPQLIKKGKRDYRLHTPIEKEIVTNGKIEKQVKAANNGENPDFRILAVDLNLDDNIAVATIMNSEGTPLVTRFFRGGNEQNGFRKRMLGWIATNRSKTRVIAKEERDNKRLWDKIHHRDENMAHKVSRRLVNFAQVHGATIIVFEHLTNLRPIKGRYSRRSNTKRAYWLKGKIFKYTRYKAWQDGGINNCRINPKNTSRDCAKCAATPVIRYRQVEGKMPSGYTPGAPLILCTACGKKDNADRNASVNIGKKLLARYVN